MLFVNALLVSKDQSLPGNAVASQFADVDASASYLPQLAYAADRGLIDLLISSKRGQLYFQPESFMTKEEAYTILSKALDVQFAYDAQQAAAEKMTRAELAQVLVESL